MRVLTLLAAVPAALPIVVVVPSAASAAAVDVPTCATRLVDAATGASAFCTTAGPPPMANTTFGVYRTVYVTAETGAVQATLQCDQWSPISTTVLAPNVRSFGTWGGKDCRLTLTSLAPGTTAVAASVGAYAGNLA